MSWVPREQTLQFDFPCLDEGFWKTVFRSQVNLLMQWLLFPPKLILWGRGPDQVSQSLGGAQGPLVIQAPRVHPTWPVNTRVWARRDELRFPSRTGQCGMQRLKACAHQGKVQDPSGYLSSWVHLPVSHTSPPSDLLTHCLGSLGLAPLSLHCSYQ